MRNMLIRPSRKELEHFHPDYVIYNAGAFPANRYTTGMTSTTSVSLNFQEKEMVILGTEYAGEMKKGYAHHSGGRRASLKPFTQSHKLEPANTALLVSSPCSSTRCLSSTTF